MVAIEQRRTAPKGPPSPLESGLEGLTGQAFNDQLSMIAGGPQPALSVSGAVEIFELAAVSGVADLLEVPAEALEQVPITNGTRPSASLILIATMAVIIVVGSTLGWMRRRLK